MCSISSTNLNAALDELIDAVWKQSRLDPRNPVVDEGAHSRHLMNTMDRSVAVVTVVACLKDSKEEIADDEYQKRGRSN